jgi:dihydrolipoamide dehydrogenase
LKGWGKISNPNEVFVKAVEGEDTTLKTKNIMIATGSDIMRFPGIDVNVFLI